MELQLLQSIRQYKEITQQEIADMIGIPINAYELKENGKIQFTIREILKLSNYLELTFNDVNMIFFNNKLSDSIFCS